MEKILDVNVFDKDLIGKDDSLGVAKVDLSGLREGQPVVMLVRLKGGDSGENIGNILEDKVGGGLSQGGSVPGKVAGQLLAGEKPNHGVLTLTLLLFSGPPPQLPPVAAASPGRLVIRLFACANLRGTDLGGKADPFVEFQIGEQVVKSKKKKGTVNPYWDGQRFELPYQTKEDKLIVRVKDKDLIGKSDLMGTAEISLKKLAAGVEVIGTYHFYGGEKGENLSNHADEMKGKVAGEVVGKIVGAPVGALVKLVTSSPPSNPGVVCLGLTLY